MLVKGATDDGYYIHEQVGESHILTVCGKNTIEKVRHTEN